LWVHSKAGKVPISGGYKGRTIGEALLEFAEKENPCGTTLGWVIRKNGDEALLAQPERNPCSVRVGFVHIMLDC